MGSLSLGPCPSGLNHVRNQKNVAGLLSLSDKCDNGYTSEIRNGDKKTHLNTIYRTTSNAVSDNYEISITFPPLRLRGIHRHRD